MTAATLAPTATRTAPTAASALNARGLSARRWRPIDSSALAAVSYDARTGDLWVEFNRSTDRFYVYHGVTGYRYRQLMQADSQGSHFARRIKPCHRCTRVEIALSSWQVA